MEWRIGRFTFLLSACVVVLNAWCIREYILRPHYTSRDVVSDSSASPQPHFLWFPSVQEGLMDLSCFVISAGCLYLLLRVSFTSCAYRKRAHLSKKLTRYCPECNLYVPRIDVTHCKECGKCIYRRSHHCDMFSNCIAQANKRSVQSLCCVILFVDLAVFYLWATFPIDYYPRPALQAMCSATSTKAWLGCLCLETLILVNGPLAFIMGATESLPFLCTYSGFPRFAVNRIVSPFLLTYMRRDFPA